MIVVKIAMNVLPEKQKELVQTLLSMIGSIEKEAGCLSYALFYSIEDKTLLKFLAERQTRTVAEILTDKQVKVLVAIAGVAVLVRKNSAIDAHAHHNKTSVYTAGMIFPMLPEKLSTDLTSLNYHEDRPAMIIEMVIGDGGAMIDATIYRARVRNQTKLVYISVAAWLDDTGSMPASVAAGLGAGRESPPPGLGGSAVKSPAACARSPGSADAGRPTRLCRRRDSGSAGG